MKIAILGTRGFPSFYGGFETAVRELAPFFANSGHQVSVYSRRKSCESNPHIPNLRVIYTPYFEKKSLETITHVISSFLHIMFSKPDVILGFNVTCALIGPFAKVLKIPLVINVDGLEWRRQKWGKIAKFTYFFLAYLASKNSTRLVADSKQIQSYWHDTFGVPSIFIAYGGKFCDLAKLRDNNFVCDLLYVARFVPENSFDLFLNLVKMLPKETRITMIGSFSNAKESQINDFKEFLKEFQNVTHLGHISNDQELFKYWNNARLYFHGHTVGGTNPALVQAMHCGARILARNTVYNREVLGDTGFYFENNISLLQQNVVDLLHNDANTAIMRTNTKNRAECFYSWNNISIQYLKLVRETYK